MYSRLLNKIDIKILIWASVLMGLMILDIVLSNGVLTKNQELISEGNRFAFILGSWKLVFAKILFVVLLTLYSIRKSSKGLLIVSSVIMSLVVIWNITMLILVQIYS